MAVGLPMPCPVVIPGARGPLVGLLHLPDPSRVCRGGVLVVPAFAEEMNRCRSMVTMQAQRLAMQGLATLVLDPRGTGDSCGEFEDADWDGWADDLRRGADWLDQHGYGCRVLWGLRLGALMAARLAAERPAVERLLLWQPVVAGKAYWTQFLRIRIAAEMGQPDGVRSTEELRRQSAAGTAVEVSGYHVGAALAQALDRLEWPAPEALKHCTVHWCEVLADADAVVPRANAKLLDAMQASGVATTSSQVIGPAFWQVHERDVAPALLEATTAIAETWPEPPGVRGAMPLPARPSEHAECPVVFDGGGATLTGVLHRAAEAGDCGVVIVVAGGPQYRAGAHRQFVSLARMLAAQGYPTLRFDLRGMGDSSGDYLGYHHSRPDIAAAIDELQRRAPGVRRVVLFGECESASGILFYAYGDARVHKIALVNPWVRTEEGRAEVILKHYYRDRLLSRRFWADLLAGRLRVGRALASFVGLVVTFLRGRRSLRAGVSLTPDADLDALPLVAKTAEGLRRFRGSVLMLMSGNDYIAREFDEVTRASQAWTGLLDSPRLQRVDIEGADHTFSRQEWKLKAHEALTTWLAQR